MLFTVTPPRDSVSLMKPSKSTITTWSIRVPSRLSRVCTISCVPPYANAALILPLPCPGMSTHMSRGKEVMYASSCALFRCTTMIESLRPAPESPGSRESEPSRTKFIAPVASGSALVGRGAVGFSEPAARPRA